MVTIHRKLLGVISLLGFVSALAACAAFGEQPQSPDYEFIRQPLASILDRLAKESGLPNETAIDPSTLQSRMNALIFGVPSDQAYRWLRTLPVRPLSLPETTETPGTPAGEDKVAPAQAILPEISSSVRQPRINIDWDQRPVKETLDSLAQSLSLPLEWHRSSQGLLRGKPLVTLHAREISVSAALQWACRLSGLECHQEEARIVVAAPGQFVPSPTRRSYDLDLLFGVPQCYPGIHFNLARHPKLEGDPEIPYGQLGRFVGEFYFSLQPKLSSFSTLRTTSPQSQIFRDGHTLVVTATPEAHQQIEAFFNQFPAYRTARKFESAFRQKVSWLLRDAPLERVAENVRRMTGAPVLLPSHPGQPLSLDLRDVELWEALRLACMVANTEMSVQGTGVISLGLLLRPSPPSSNFVNPFECVDHPLDLVLGELAQAAGKNMPMGFQTLPPVKVSLFSNYPPAGLLDWLIDHYQVDSAPGTDPGESPTGVWLEASHAGLAWEAVVARKMEKKVSFDFQETSFNEVVEYLRTEGQWNVVVDPAALRLVARGGELAVRAKAENVTLEAALAKILEPLRLRWRVLDEAIYITTPADEMVSPELRLYSIADLAGQPDDFPGFPFLIRADSEAVLKPASLDNLPLDSLPANLQGTPISVWPLGSRLAVVCLPVVHDHIAARFNEVREYRIVQDLRSRFSRRVSLCLKDVPAEKVLQFFQKHSGLNFVRVGPALNQLERYKVTLEVFQVQAWEALRYACQTTGLTCWVEGNGTIVIQ